MKKTLSFLLVSALAAAPLALTAGEGACAASGSACCATKAVAKASGSCSGATASACASASGPNVSVKLKRSHRAQALAALQSLEGVKSVETCSDTKFTTVSYDKEKVCSDKIMAAIRTAGGSVQAQRASFAVNDVACGECATKVTKALNKVKGVADAQVCPVSKVATVEYNPGKTCSGTILAALDQAGFKATEMVQ